MSMEFANLVRAACSVTASAHGGATVPTFVWSDGINQAASLHDATGVYKIALDQEVDAAQCALVVTQRGAGVAGTFAVADTSDSVKTVTTYAAGVASNAISFNMLVLGAPNT